MLFACSILLLSHDMVQNILKSYLDLELFKDGGVFKHLIVSLVSGFSAFVSIELWRNQQPEEITILMYN